MEMKNIISELKTSIVAVLALAVLVCGAYPALLWCLSQEFFHFEANGSMVVREGKRTGSYLIGQTFTAPKYFHPRPSAAGDGYDALSSGGSNLGPMSKKLGDTVRQRVTDYRAENGLAPNVPVPADAVTASGSGLDPHISLANARLQASRVAQARGLSREAVLGEVARRTEGRDLGIFGEPRVHVLKLNMALDGIKG
jgi:potassium-transporting ATPase KdpC subunit